MNKKLPLSKVLFELDNRNINFYETLCDENKKEFQPFVLMRFMSSSSDSAEISKLSLISTNEFVNKHFWDLSKEKELFAKLLPASGLGFKLKHSWIVNKKTKNTDIIYNLAKEYHKYVHNWDANKTEINIFISKLSIDDIKEICHDLGKQQDETKKITNEFKKVYM